jgi:MerR family redox-sensitive transcriptional activator SoxR
MPEPLHELLTIGELARRAGRRPSSLRYYEAIGLLPEPVRIGGHRRYPSAVLRTLTVIETAQRAGLSLEEIKDLLGASPEDDSATQRLRDVAERKLPEVEALIERAELVRRWLQAAARCECPTLEDCALFEDAARFPPTRSDEHEVGHPYGPRL